MSDALHAYATLPAWCYPLVWRLLVTMLGVGYETGRRLFAPARHPRKGRR